MHPTVTVDIGTTSVKLCVFDADGHPLATARQATPTTKDAWGEVYDLDTLKQLVLDFVHELGGDIRSSVRRITVAGVGESGGLVRPDLSLASPMILWHDHRGADYIASLSPAQKTLIYRVTGLPANANYGLSKVAWALAHSEPTAAGNAQWLNVAEYLAAWMTGQRWSERSLASRTMALDVASSTWSAEIADLFGVPVDVFPELRNASHGATVTRQFAQQSSLDPVVTVHVAGHDHMVGAVGADLHRGELLNSTGTTEGLLFLRGTPSLGSDSERAKLANGLACEGPDYTLFASIPTGGSAFATLQTMLGLGADQLSGRISALHTRYMNNQIDWFRVPLVLPQFRGSAPPTKQAAARGIVTGIASDTTTDDVVLGCFIGMVLQFRDVLDLFRMPVERVKVIGPASGNDLWLQLKADLLRTQLSVSRFPEVVSRGAQALASQTPLTWESCQPREIAFDETRATSLEEWAAGNAARWEYMKGMPV